jgi:hypothetical protein
MSFSVIIIVTRSFRMGGKPHENFLSNTLKWLMIRDGSEEDVSFLFIAEKRAEKMKITIS